MRMHRHLKTFVTLTALTTVGAAVACAPAYGRHERSGVEVAVQWDSGPLDRDYGREHADLVTRHNREIANPERGESRYDMDRRQANENNALEARYKHGRQTHADVLPPS
jgi:hypothetical protein